jgi:hypothetical protein
MGMSSGENTYVFAVCGGKEHIDTLNLTLRYLRQYSRQNILVVTDLSRNEGKIAHDQVLNIQTSVHFDHHQASIYLKTGLHKFVDLSQGTYCYLDSDVLAVDDRVDEIFAQKKGPVVFAADHCQMREFSPYTVRCGCMERQNERKGKLSPLMDALIDSWEGRKEGKPPDDAVPEPEKRAEFLELLQNWARSTRITDPVLQAKRDRLMEMFAQARGSRGKLIKTLLFKVLPRYFRHPLRRIWYDWRGNVVVHEDAQSWFRRKHGLEYRPEAGGWYDKQGNMIMEGFDELIHERTGFRWNPAANRYEDEAGAPVFPAHCDHLREAIREKFGIEIGEQNWQHWNGGVFLFDEESVPFLDAWHDMTMQIFEDPDWRTRDQGTLIATVWKMGLQDQQPLSSEFNFLADYNSTDLRFSREKGFTKDGFKTSIQPHFVHIYHHWGDKNWEVWRWAESRL